MKQKALLLLALSLMAGCTLGEPKWQVGEPTIEISNCLLYKGKTYFKNLDEVRARFRPQKIKVTHEDRFEDCKDAIRKAKIDADKGALRIVRFNGFSGTILRKDVLFKELLGVEVYNTGCTIHSWADCYNEEMEKQIQLRFGEHVLTLLDKYERLKKEKVLIDIAQRKLVKVTQLPDFGEWEYDFRNVVSKIRCYENIVYMAFEIEVQKSGQIGAVIQTGGNPDTECRGKLTKLIKNYQRWQPAMKAGKPIDSIVSLLLIF